MVETFYPEIEGFEVDLSRIYRAADQSALRKDFAFLQKAVEGSFRGLEWCRTLNQNLVEAYAGPAYGNPRDKRKRYLYKMHQMVDAFMMMLAANRPVVQIDTQYTPLRAFAKHFQSAINNLLKEIGLEHTIRRWVLDAIFTIGVVKVHRKDAGDTQFERDLWMDPGSPFASNVSLDNFVYDMTARSWSEVKWAGDMYRIPYSDLEEGAKLGMYDAEVVKECKPTSKYWHSQDRLAAISAGEAVDTDEYEPMVDLCDLWIARERCIYTFVITNVANFSIKTKPLAHMDWDDPDCGPYHILGFNDVPENVMPIGPAVIIDELDRLANNVMRKQSRGAMNQKDVLLYRPGQGAETAKQVQRSNDGGMVAGDPSEVGRVSFNGANAGNQLFLQQVLAMLNELAGNPTAVLGLGAQTDTATQDELIHSANNRKFGQMQYRVLDATTRLIRSLGLMLWDDEIKTVVAEMPVEGTTGYAVDATWRPGDREGNFIDYNFGINVHSMVFRPPSAQAQALIELMTTIYIPLQDQISQQGGVINFSLLNDNLAEMLNLSVLKDIVTFQGQPPSDDKPSTSSRGGKPPMTERSYTRRSIPSGEAAKMQDQQLMQQWMQQGQQPVMGSAVTAA